VEFVRRIGQRMCGTGSVIFSPPTERQATYTFSV